MIRRRGQGPDLSLLLLFMQIYQVGADNIGYVTMALLGINAGLFYLDLDFLPQSLGQVCIGAREVWSGHQWSRLLLHAFFHANPMHLYYNMTSLLWKVSPEKRKKKTLLLIRDLH